MTGQFVPPPATLVTYQFLHAGWVHLLGNLLFLWFFGPRVEATLGAGPVDGAAADLRRGGRDWPRPGRNRHRRWRWWAPAAASPACLGRTSFSTPGRIPPAAARPAGNAAARLGRPALLVRTAAGLCELDEGPAGRCRLPRARGRVCLRPAAGAGATLPRVVVCGCAPRCPNSQEPGFESLNLLPVRSRSRSAAKLSLPLSDRRPGVRPTSPWSSRAWRSSAAASARRRSAAASSGSWASSSTTAGRQAIVVRVPRSGGGNRITLPGPGGTLDLDAVNPGPLEYLRAAVDYDGIPPSDLWRFNLSVQRIRSPANPLVEEQENWRAVTVVPDDEGYIGDVLAGSSLVRLHGEPPRARPYVTPGAAGIGPIGYVHGRGNWRSAAPPSDYDLIGSADDATGIHALEQVANVDLVCLLSGAPKADVGPVGIFAAERYCARRNAILLLDPPAHWSRVEDVARSQRDSAIASPNVITYFPQLTELSADGRRTRSLSALGAIAGMLASGDPPSSACSARRPGWPSNPTPRRRRCWHAAG